MSKCPYCNSNDFEPLNDTVDYSGIEIAICGLHSMLRVRTYIDKYKLPKWLYNGVEIVNINYCPMCGRKLGDK